MKNGDLRQIRGWIKSISDEVKNIDKKLDNHLHTVGEDISAIKTDLSWVKKFFWIVTTPLIGTGIITIIRLILE